MKKVVIVLLMCLLITGCKEKVKTEIITSNTTLEYASEVKLSELLKIKNGKLITKDYFINTDKLGKSKIEIEYYDSNNNNNKYNFEIEIKDTKKPLIFVPD